MKKIFNNKKIIYIVLFIVIVLVGGSSFLIGYNIANHSINEVKKENINTKKALEQLQKLVDENINKQFAQKEIKPILKDKNKTKVTSSEALDYQENSVLSKKEVKPTIYTTKPKLVIIMDDMSFYSQIKNLKSLHINITPSFFPPSKRHPNTSKYAKFFKHYMVHFPMQATNPNFKEESNTLHIDSSTNFIKKRVEFIKKQFPNVKFVNNHTGSKFTSNTKAMQRLFSVLKAQHIIFVDSRTTSHTKAPLVAKQYHQLLLSRDVFLDNKENIKYIENQLRKAVKISQKRGYAIAICHPHHTTFEALKDSKKLLKNVEVIYLDELYKLYQTNHLSKL